MRGGVFYIQDYILRQFSVQECLLNTSSANVLDYFPKSCVILKKYVWRWYYTFRLCGGPRILPKNPRILTFKVSCYS